MKRAAAIVPAPPAALATTARAQADVRDAAAVAAAGFVVASKAPNTLRAYLSDWKMFKRWCASAGLEPLPAAPDTVAMYVGALAGGLVPRVKRWRPSAAHRPASIERYLAAIAHVHATAGHDAPTHAKVVHEALEGARRTLGMAVEKKAPALGAIVTAMARALDDGTDRGTRDAAIVLVGFAGAFRRSELVALNWTDVEEREGGLVITIRKSKTDQRGVGRTVHVHRAATAAHCPVNALLCLGGAEGRTGAVFRSACHRNVGARLTAAAVAAVVKGAAKAVGLEPARYAGHSLRRGFVQTAAAKRKGLDAIQAVTGHRSLDMLAEYLAKDLPWGDDDAGAGLL